MRVTQLPFKALKGLSFSVADLVLIGSWSEANGFRMVVRLDHGSDAEDTAAFEIGYWFAGDELI